MIVDLDTSGPERLAGYDLCVVGTGPAGMTLVNELRDAGLAICVLESGRLHTTKLGDELRKVRSEGIRIKDYSRERVLGGASTTWAGLSSALDEIDLAPRSFLQHSGWPLAREELLRYYEEAAERYRFAPLAMFGAQGFGALRARGELQPEWRDLEEKVFLAAGEPQDFGREWRDVFEVPGIDLHLDATLIRLESAGDGDAARVARGVVRTHAGRTVTVEARVFALATGGIENARILLSSRDGCPQGLGNERDQVGRYLMNHPKNYHGVLRLARPVRKLPYYFGCLNQGFAGYAGIRLRQEVQAERGLVNSYVRFEPLYPWSDNRGVEAFVFLVKHSGRLVRRWKHRHADEVVELRDYSETGDDTDLQNERKTAADWLRLCGSILLNAPMVARYVVSRLRHGRAPEVRRVRLRNFMEMEPDPENRVLLGDDADPYGQPVPVVRHQTSELDRRSLVALHRALIDEVARAGLGELDSGLAEADPWPIDQDASHHLGTTRMGDDPARSVVDPRGRLHSVPNVYLAGGSVFPTSGCANPTWTIVALSIRLAEHLRREVSPSPAGRPSEVLP